MTDACWETSSYILVDWLDGKGVANFSQLPNAKELFTSECAGVFRKKSEAKLFFALSMSIMFLTSVLPRSWLLTADSHHHATLNSLMQTLHFAKYRVVPGLSHELYLSFSINAFLNMHFPLAIFKKIIIYLPKMKWFTESSKFSKMVITLLNFAFIHHCVQGPMICLPLCLRPMGRPTTVLKAQWYAYHAVFKAQQYQCLNFNQIIS